MSGLVGADVEELQHLAADFSAGAQELRELGSRLTGAIDAAHDWQGQDATRCKDDWTSFAQGQLTGVSDALATAGRLLEENAREQEVASGTESGGGTGWGLLDFAHDLFPLGKIALGLKGLWDKGKGLAGFFAALRMPLVKGFAALNRAEAVAKAVAQFRDVFNGGTKLGWLGGVRTLAGKLSLPVTTVSALADIWRGGGYDGLRGWATRGFAVAGAAGGVVAIASAAGLVAVAPVTLAVAGAGVALYSAWGLGNYVVDHRTQIGHFVRDVVTASWRPDGWARAQVGQALSWARGLLAPAPSPLPSGA